MLLNIDNLEDKPSTENSREGNNKEVINYHSLMDLDKSDSLGNKKYVDILEDKVKISSSKTIGLMGSWGSGKSSIIFTLEKRILASSRNRNIFMIHDAWKYQGDSFKRSFILDLEKNMNLDKNKLPIKWYKKTWSFITKVRNGFKDETIEEVLYRQKNHTVNFRYINGFALTAFVLIIIFGLYFFLKIPEFWNELLTLSTFVSLLAFLLTSVNLFSRSSSLTTINSPLSKPEEFEKVFKRLISKIKKNVKLIIVIDNIDRCTSDVAYDILSSVKTFFNSENTSNNHEILFIIPIDHLMLKSHLKKSFNYSNWDTNCFLKKIFDDVYYLNNYNTDHHVELAKNYCKENNISLSYSFFELIGKLGLNNPRDIIEFTKDVNEEITLLAKSLDTQLVKDNDYIIAILYYLKQHNEELLGKICLTNNLYNIESEDEYKICILYLTELPISAIRTFIIALANTSSNDNREIIDAIANLNKEKFDDFYRISQEKIISVIKNASVEDFKQKGLELLITHIVSLKENRHCRDISIIFSDIQNNIKKFNFPKEFIEYSIFMKNINRHLFHDTLINYIKAGNMGFEFTNHFISLGNQIDLKEHSIWIIKNLTKNKNLKNMEKIPKEKLEILNFQNSYDSLFTEFFANQIEKDVFEYLVINSADYLSTSYKRTSTDLNIFEFFLLHANESSHIFVNKESTIKFLSLINEIIIKYSKVIKNNEFWTYFKKNPILSNFVKKLLESYNREEKLYFSEELTQEYITCVIKFMNLSIIISQENVDETNLWFNFYNSLSSINNHNEIAIYDYFKEISKFKDIDKLKHIITDNHRLEWFEKDCKPFPKLMLNKIPEIFS